MTETNYTKIMARRIYALHGDRLMAMAPEGLRALVTGLIEIFAPLRAESDGVILEIEKLLRGDARPADDAPVGG